MKTPPIRGLQALFLIGCLAAPVQLWGLKKISLDLAKNSVDDQFQGCGAKRELKVQAPGYLPVPPKYWDTWQKAQWHWAQLSQSVAGSIPPVYGTAVVAYTMAGGLYSDFNRAVRVGGKSQKAYHQFPFKDFHFLLTKVVKMREVPGQCYEVFRGVKGIRFKAHFKQAVRFGQFASASLIKAVAQKFGQDTFFSIKTCHGVPVYDLSQFPQEREVLIPPYEKFAVTHHGKGPNGVIVRLESRGVYSCFNCDVLLKGH